MKIEGFKKVDYETIQSEMQKTHKPDSLPEINIAAQIGVKSVQTVKSAFNKEFQAVSDEVLSGVLGQLGITSLIVWEGGQKNFYISNGKT